MNHNIRETGSGWFEVCRLFLNVFRLFQTWEPLSAIAKVNIKHEIDAVREHPLRLPLTATAGRNQVQKWIYSEKESVNVTSLAQMHVLSVKVNSYRILFDYQSDLLHLSILFYYIFSISLRCIDD